MTYLNVCQIAVCTASYLYIYLISNRQLFGRKHNALDQWTEKKNWLNFVRIKQLIQFIFGGAVVATSCYIYRPAHMRRCYSWHIVQFRQPHCVNATPFRNMWRNGPGARALTSHISLKFNSLRRHFFDCIPFHFAPSRRTQFDVGIRESVSMSQWITEMDKTKPH